MVEIIKKLSKKEKQKLLTVLQEEMPVVISLSQKQEVRKRLKKYEAYPGLLISEDDTVQHLNFPEKKFTKKEKEILKGIEEAVIYINKYKAGKAKARDARELINEL